MIKLYAVNISDISYEEASAYLEALSAGRVARVERFRFEKDKIRSIFAEMIVRHVLTKECDFADEDIKFGEGDKGKPYLINTPSPVFFNVSHAGDYVVCALGDAQVGIDVEEIRDKDIKCARAVLTKRELDIWNRLSESCKVEEFYRIWTIKESYSKYLGVGLSLGFSDVECDYLEQRATPVFDAAHGYPAPSECRVGDGACIVRTFKPDEAHFISVCVAAEAAERLDDELHYLTLSDF